jgi:hypothetical protein
MASSRLKGGSQAGRPTLWLSRWRTVALSLPAAANSGHQRATGASMSTRPRSTSIRTAKLVTVLLPEKTLTIVSRVQGAL